MAGVRDRPTPHTRALPPSSKRCMHAHALPVCAHTCRCRNKTQGRTAAKARSPQVHAQKARSAKKSKMRGGCFRTRCHNPDVAAPKKDLQNPKTGRRRARQGQLAAGARLKSKMREKNKMRGGCFRTGCHNPEVAAPKNGPKNAKTKCRRDKKGRLA